MANEIAVKVPDNTGGHWTIFSSITTDLGNMLGAGYPVFPWGGLPDGSFGPIGGAYSVTVNFAGTGGYLLNGCPLNVIFGQGWFPGQQDLLRQYGVTCQALPTGAIAAPVSGGPINTGSTTQGGLTTFNPTPQTSGAENSAVAAAISPSLTPGSPGSPPTGASVGQATNPRLNAIYRFILHSGPNRFDTGANYPGCSQVNNAMCDPQQFTTLDAAVEYAHSRDEIPYIVNSASEVWGLINGTVAFNPKQIYGSGGISPLILIAAGLAIFFLLRR